jgi:DNA polymerase-1
MLALIDGDLAAYRASAATQKAIRFADDEEPSIWANPAEAIASALATIDLWVQGAGADKAMVFLTGDGNFRKAIYPAYKSNRSGVARPLALKQVREAIRDRYQTVTVDGLEADDLLGMTLTTPRMAGKAVCVSMDKDLKNVPGLHYNPAKDREPVFVMEAEANRWWFTQALTGDASDGYPGCPKVGPVKAERLLGDWDGVDLLDGYCRVSDAFIGGKKFTDEAEAAGQAVTMIRLARILRHGDYDKHEKRHALWHPTTPEWLDL